MGEAGHGVGDPVAAEDGKNWRRIIFLACDNGVDVGGGVGPPLRIHGVREQEVGGSK